MKTIKLGKEVMVSDPCYTVGTWCQKRVDNVWPGDYRVFCLKHDTGDWGVRVSMLMAIHKDHLNGYLKWKREGDIGVDSGQAGIFDMSTYRVNPDNVNKGDGDISFFGVQNTPEEQWYINICSHTLGESRWGTYKNGVVSSSGLGDGAYDLFLARYQTKVIGFAIDFNVENDTDINWYKDEPQEINQ